MINYPEFHVARTSDEVMVRVTQLEKDLLSANEEQRKAIRSRLTVLLCEITPEDVEIKYSERLQYRDDALAESLWLYGLKEKPNLNTL